MDRKNLISFQNVVDNGDDLRVERVYGFVLADDFIPDDDPVRFVEEFAAFESIISETFFDQLYQCSILGGVVCDGRQQALLHAGELKQHPSSEERAELHQVVLFGVEIDLIGPPNSLHLVWGHLIQALAVDPHEL